MCKAEMHHHPAHPDGAVIRLAQEEGPRPPYPEGWVLRIVDLHLVAAALADSHLLVLQLTAQDAVFCATAVAPYTLYRYRLPDAARGHTALFDVGDPQEYRFRAARQDALLEI